MLYIIQSFQPSYLLVPTYILTKPVSNPRTDIPHAKSVLITNPRIMGSAPSPLPRSLKCTIQVVYAPTPLAPELTGITIFQTAQTGHKQSNSSSKTKENGNAKGKTKGSSGSRSCSANLAVPPFTTTDLATQPQTVYYARSSHYPTPRSGVGALKLVGRPKTLVPIPPIPPIQILRGRIRIGSCSLENYYIVHV
jgi:hypothetical protein